MSLKGLDMLGDEYSDWAVWIIVEKNSLIIIKGKMIDNLDKAIGKIVSIKIFIESIDANLQKSNTGGV